MVSISCIRKFIHTHFIYALEMCSMLKIGVGYEISTLYTSIRVDHWYIQAVEHTPNTTSLWHYKEIDPKFRKFFAQKSTGLEDIPRQTVRRPWTAHILMSTLIKIDVQMKRKRKNKPLQMILLIAFASARAPVCVCHISISVSLRDSSVALLDANVFVCVCVLGCIAPSISFCSQ